MGHQTCRNIVVRSGSYELQFSTASFLGWCSQEKCCALKGGITFQDSYKAEKCCDRAGGNEVMTARVTDAGERIVFGVESDDPSASAVGAGKGGFETMGVGCNF